MYKGRLEVWVFVLSICCLISFFIEKIPVWTHTDDISISIDVKSDTDMAEHIINKDINHFRYVSKTENSDLIIRSSSEEQIEGYRKLSNVLYSPIVMYVNSDMQKYSDKDSGFIKLTENNSSYNTYRIDLYDVLVAMEKGKEWSSLNINKNIVKGTIRLTIPNKHCSYYEDIVDLFYFTLNNYKVPTEKERAKLKNRVDKIIGKCDTVSDIHQAIIDECKDCKNQKVFIGPEYLCVRNGKAFLGNRSYNDSFAPIYFSKHTFVTADIYIKEHTDKTKNEIVNKFEKNIYKNEEFMENIGWRIKNSTFDVTKIHGYMINNPV